ncbi:Pre-mRNA-splicing factor SF2 [Corchorus olitorius]|uniref:Pre-mRNA-splicing factor SF2 n=1 Tax=Corchorus olitorius TaxID=93759 RepID=A0A1R3IH68_9ROSI|nr:Pre-mRNA-splicing factor SF2 [Corchorus olitorius]
MASGWGINGNKGRCYDFWADFSECMSHCREPKDCALLREDYLECLHHSKELTVFHALLRVLKFPNWTGIRSFQRRNRIYKEEQRKLRAATQKGKEGEVDGHHHA